jgi:hypothetical protein
MPHTQTDPAQSRQAALDALDEFNNESTRRRSSHHHSKDGPATVR